MERTWPLTGRDGELRDVVASVRAGGRGVVVAGPAGVGKTRLVHEALAAPGRGVVWVHGSSAARPLPFGAFAGVLDLDAPDETVGVALERLARRRPLVVAVDDAHLLDEHSAVVLHRCVVRRLAPVVITLRTGEPAPDVVTALWKDDLLPRLDLAPLGPEATAVLTARALGGPVDSASTRRLWSLTEGIPLFLRHLVPGEVASGRFTPSSGIWRWTSEPEISPELAGLVEQQIGELAAEVQDVVDLVALAEPVAVATLIATAGRAAVEEAEGRSLVAVDGSVARLVHPLYGEVRRTAMGSLRARRLRGVVALTLDPTADPIPRAVLTLDSDLPPDPALFLGAAQAAMRMYDLPLAERLAGAAATTGAPMARLVHAATLSWLTRGEEAEAILSDIADRADPVEEADLRATAHLHRAGNLLWTLARPDAARAALAAAAETGALPVHVEAMSLALGVADLDLAPALRRGPALLRTEAPDDLAAILVASAVAGASALTGDRQLLREAAEAGGLTADRVPTTIPGFGLADLQVLGHRLAGTPGEGEDLARRMLTASADLPGPARLMGLVVGGHAALACGRVADALALLQEAWAGLRDTGHEFRFRCRTLLATAYGQAGDGAAAAPLLAGIVEGQHPAYRFLGPEDLLARAWGEAAAGSVSEALAHAVGAGECARETGAPAYEVLALQTAVQLGDPGPALPGLTRLAGLGPRASVALDHARACADADADALLAAARAWLQVGDLVAAADAAAQACDLHRRHGRPGSALAAAALARRWSAQSGAVSPALAVALRPLPLTGREREIVELAARGLSNQAIADRLTVSVRTVEGHVYRACRKLGVADRTALADILDVE